MDAFTRSVERMFDAPLLLEESEEAQLAVHWLIPTGPDARDSVISTAEQCNISPMLLTRLHRRQVEPDSVPVALLTKLGEVLGCSAGQIYVYLQQDDEVATAAMFKRQPGCVVVPATKLPFKDAVISSPDMDEADREEWLSLCSL